MLSIQIEGRRDMGEMTELIEMIRKCKNMEIL